MLFFGDYTSNITRIFSVASHFPIYYSAQTVGAKQFFIQFLFQPEK